MDTQHKHLETAAVQREEMFEIGDLGSFSMNAIYLALTNGGVPNGVDARQEGRSEVDNGAEDSDCSWTHAEDMGDFYIDIRRRLDEFVLTADQTTMTTAILSRRQRRFVHATAQVMRLGHASLGAQGRNRRMIIFKKEPHSTSTVNKMLEQSRSESRTESEKTEVPPSPPESLPKKRKRVQKIYKGFPCQFEPCRKVFNRASERTKHEQTHQPALTTRFQCSRCDKGFRYPKDLRRHQKIHDNPVDHGSLGLLSSSFGSSLPVTSIFSSESRVPSDTSLNFSSKNASKDNSPSLAPWNGDCGVNNPIEPLMLGEAAWASSTPYIDENFQFPFEELACFDFDENDGFEDGFGDGFLEMARAKK